MALNPNIPLMPRAVDVGSAFQNALLNVGRIQNMQQQAAQAQQTQQANQQALQSNALKQLVTVAPAVLQAAQAGDVAGLRSLAGNLPPQAQQEFNSMIEAGDFGGIATQAQRLADLAPQLGLSGKTGLASAKTEILPGGAVIQSLPTGDVQVIGPDGRILQGEERVKAIEQSKDFQIKLAGQKSEATARGAADVELDTAADIAERKKFGEMTGASRAKAIDSGFERVQKLSENIANLDKAIEAVNQGAGVGAIERRFPSIRNASVLLDQIQGQLALDVVGAVTFGALSEGELDLAKQVALPAGLDGPELVKWLQDKKAAQQKLANYFQEQIDFLDQGGTVAGFLRMKRRGQPQQTPQQQTAQQPAQQQVIRFDAQGNIVQ